jgi:hypothetical protein
MAVETVPQSVSARIWVAMSLAERGRFAEAAARADKAMEIAQADCAHHPDSDATRALGDEDEMREITTRWLVRVG